MNAKSSKSKLHRKLGAARRSLTVWFSTAVPVLLAGAESLKENLPALGGMLTGWKLVAASALVSAVVVALRLRKEGHDQDERK